MSMKKIAIFAPYGTFTVHHQVDAMVGSALKVRGCDVSVFLCDGLFENCPVAGRPPDPAKCRSCASASKGFFSGFPLESLQLRAFLNEADFREVRKWADGLQPENMHDAVFEGMDVGSWTHSTVHQYFLKGTLDVYDDQVAKAYRGFLYSAALIVRGFGRAIDSKQLDYLLCFSGMNAYYRVAYEVAKAKGVKSLVHERGYIDDSFVLPGSGFPHQDESLARAWEAWRDIPLSQEECRRIRKYFEDRELGRNSNYINFYRFTSEAESVRSALRIPAGAKIVGLFPSTDLEVGMILNTLRPTFNSQLEWMRATAKVCSEEGAYLVIRHHPNNVHASRVAFSFIQDLLELAKEFPDTVRVVMPDEKLTSYALLWNVDLAVTLVTTMGAEAFVRGIPTICLTDYLFRHMGIEWIRAKDEYASALRRGIGGMESIEVGEFKRAYRFAYLIYFRLSFRFKSFGIKDVHGPDIRISNLEELAPGKDEVMDQVCDHILSGAPMYPLPDGGRGPDAASAEQTFLEGVREEYLGKRRSVRTHGWKPGGLSDSRVSVLKLRRGQFGDSGPRLDASLNRSRHRNFEVVTVFCPAYRGLGESLAALADAVDSCRTDFIYVGMDSTQVDESAFSTALDLLARPGQRPMDTVAWGAWLCDGSGTVKGEALTERSKGKGFAELADSHAAIGNALVLLTLSLWRKPALRAFLAELSAAADDSPETCARTIFEKFTTAESGIWKSDLPLAAIHPEGESMETPVRDIAWLMDLAGRLPEAEDKYRQALIQDPEDRGSLLNFARMLSRQGRTEELREVVSPYLARHKNDGDLAGILESSTASPPQAAAKEAFSNRIGGVSSESWKPASREIAAYEEVAHLVEAVPGWLLQGQEKFLFEKVKSLPDNALIMEIGCDQGRSTTAMAFACVGTGKRIYSIDSFCGNDGMMATAADFMENWRANLARNGLDGYVTPVKGYSYDVLRDWKGPSQFDFAFIDASHEYVDVLTDFQLVYPLIRTGGWMAFHDVEPGWPGPWRAWLEYGHSLLTDRAAVATLACGRKSRVASFEHVDHLHSDFSFARSYREYLADLFKGGAAVLTDAMETSLAGRYATPAEKDAMHSAEILLGGMPEHVPFRSTLRSMISKDARLDGHLLLWNAMTLMAEAKWEDAYRSLLDATRVSRPLPVERVKGYCQVLKEKLGPAGRSLPDPGAASFGTVSADSGSGGSGAGHYGQDYFNWQKHIGAFGGVANLFKFRDFIKTSDTVVDLGSGGGYLLRNVDCARKMGVEINPAARREASLHAGIDAVESPRDLPDGYADVVISNHALEHMHSPLHVLKTLLPKLKVGGKLVLVVPSEPPTQAWEPNDINKHLFTWNPMTLGNLVALAGFKVIQVEAIQHQWVPDFMQAFQRLGEEGFHAACREHAKRNGNYQIRVVAMREASASDPSHRFSVSENRGPAASEIPVALMTYRRPEHTAKVLKALESLGVRNLHVFSDGPKSEADRADVEATRNLCRSLPWANLKYEESKENRGLARSIMHATDQILERHEHLILLEDDCVPQRHFMDFMGQCLERYRDNPKVYGVSGYTVPLTAELRRNLSHDAYFFPRIGSWGWATWRRAWNHLDRNLGNAYRTVLEMGVDIHQGGNDIQPSVEGMLRNQVKDVWTLNWVLSVYARGGVYAYPRESHIQNIGFDGTGVHCGATTRYDTLVAERPPVALPGEVSVDQAIARHFRSFYDIG
jgi:SAM-dependent methyltransferase/predicted O-methyltransferase YrrM